MRPNGCSGKLCPMQVGAADNCELTKKQCPYFTQDIDYQKALKVIKSAVAMEILSDLKKQVHDKAIYPGAKDTYSFVNVKVFDAVLNNVLKKYTEGKDE